MFERQNDGVLLISRSQDLATGLNHESVLFANEAFKKLANAKDDNSVIDSSVVLLAQEEDKTVNTEDNPVNSV